MGRQSYDLLGFSMTVNTEWKRVYWSFFAALLFTALCLGSYLFMDGMSGGFAIAFVSLFLAISGGVLTLLFVHRARVMDAILNNPSPLAHWVYQEEIGRENVERECREFQGRNRLMFYLIGGMLAIVALFFVIFVGDGGRETALILLVIAALLFVVSRVTPGLERRRAMNTSHNAIITREGIVYQGTVYPFRSFLVWWHGVVLREAGKKRPASLVFSFTQIVGRATIQPFDVVVPVPAGEEETAGRIVQDLNGEMPESPE